VLALGGWRAIFIVLALVAAALIVLIAVALPESLPLEGRRRQGLADTLRAFRVALGHGAFVRLSLTGGAIQAAMFAYIAGSPFVFIELFGVPPSRFGLIFGTNAFGLVAASQLNRWLAHRIGVRAALHCGIVTALVAYSALFVAVRAGGGLPLILPALFLGVSTYGMVVPNATAAAMDHFGSQAGSASAVLGVLQATCGALASAAVSALADGTARPLATVTLACATAAAALVFRREPGRHRT
jgi:DHA1 family bicyclomycin/chloramphenicol resistance-like MFS transporter